LEKDLSRSKAAEELALERAQKAKEIAEGLHKEEDTETASSTSLLLEVELLKKRLDEAKVLGLAASEAYASALIGFGAVMSSLPAESLVSGLFKWMSANFAKLPDFIGKVLDFALLSSATNLARTLAEGGGGHVEVLKRKKDYESPAKLGETPKAVYSAVRRFMSYFWCKFGRQDARSLAEACRAEVCLRTLMLSFLVF
jgi:hypothetical protein